MWKDFAAVQTLNNCPISRTAHRRGLRIGGKFHDIHFRLKVEPVDGSAFSLDYCHSLGHELASLDFSVIQDFVHALFNALVNPEVVGDDVLRDDERIFFVADSSDLRLFEVLRNTLFSVVLNNFMSKYLTLFKCIAF